MFPHPSGHLLSSLNLATLVGVKWHLTEVWICIFLMANAAEHLFLCLLAICVSPLKKCLFRSFAHCLNWIIFLLLNCRVLPNFLLLCFFSANHSQSHLLATKNPD